MSTPVGGLARIEKGNLKHWRNTHNAHCSSIASPSFSLSTPWLSSAGRSRAGSPFCYKLVEKLKHCANKDTYNGAIRIHGSLEDVILSGHRVKDEELHFDGGFGLRSKSPTADGPSGDSDVLGISSLAFRELFSGVGIVVIGQDIGG